MQNMLKRGVKKQQMKQKMAKILKDKGGKIHFSQTDRVKFFEVIFYYSVL